MYSTASNPAFVQRAYSEGANVYFPKPESFKTLQESLKQLLNLNWQEPRKVTEDYCSDGQYKVFSLAI
jgi:DNA-binding NarL/FixJ family response regulator